MAYSGSTHEAGTVVPANFTLRSGVDCLILRVLLAAASHCKPDWKFGTHPDEVDLGALDTARVVEAEESVVAFQAFVPP